MSSVIPDTIEGRINFLQSKVAPWTTNAAAIGTSTGAVTSMAAKLAATRAKLDAAIAARELSLNATAELKEASRELALAGAGIVKQIKAKAAADGVGVYFLAQIPAPAAPTPVGDPGTPSDFKVTLNPDGSLSLKWACANPAGAGGTMYQVARRLDGAGGTSGEFAPIGGSGVRSFEDATLPAGVACVTYQVTAVRSTARGTPAQFVVNFGCVAGGAMTASVAAATKLAA